MSRVVHYSTLTAYGVIIITDPVLIFRGTLFIKRFFPHIVEVTISEVGIGHFFVLTAKDNLLNQLTPERTY